MSLEKTKSKTERLLEEDEQYIGAANKVRLFLAAAASAAGSTITVTLAWFLAPARIKAGPPMSMFSMQLSKSPPLSTVDSKG